MWSKILYAPVGLGFIVLRLGLLIALVFLRLILTYLQGAQSPITSSLTRFYLIWCGVFIVSEGDQSKGQLKLVIYLSHIMVQKKNNFLNFQNQFSRSMAFLAAMNFYLLLLIQLKLLFRPKTGNFLLSFYEFPIFHWALVDQLGRPDSFSPTHVTSRIFQGRVYFQTCNFIELLGHRMIP